MATINQADTQPRTTLHVIYDPLCGWCYGAAPLLDAAQQVDGLAMALHGGGMLTNENRRMITPEWRNYVMPHDRRIAELTGQAFGEGYYQGLLNDLGAMMDSAPPTTAILSAQALAECGVAMLHRIQQAHYIEGKRISEESVLLELAVELGIDAARFRETFQQLQGEATASHIAESRQLLASLHGHGFPTFALQRADGEWTVLSAGEYYGDIPRWQQVLERAVNQ